MKSLIKRNVNRILNLAKRLQYFRIGNAWCNHVLSLRKEKPKVSPEILRAYKKKWRPLSKFVSVKYPMCFADRFENPKDLVNVCPEDICHAYIEPVLNPLTTDGFYDDKNNFAKLLPKEYFPDEWIHCIDGVLYDGDYAFVPKEKLKETLAQAGASTDRIFLKPAVSDSGRGIVFFDWNGKDFLDKAGKTVWDHYQEGMRNFVIQSAFVQSDFTGQFGKTSVNTLRIITYRSVLDEQVTVPSMIMRIGKNGTFVDNAHAGGMFVGISPQKGTLGKYVSDQFGNTVRIFNGIDFSKETFVIPNFERILEFAKDVGRRIPHHRLLALDCVLDAENSPKLLEFNVNGFSCWFGQAPFGDKTDEIIDYCAKHKGEIQRLGSIR